jgi:hypothetical protein
MADEEGFFLTQRYAEGKGEVRIGFSGKMREGGILRDCYSSVAGYSKS